MGVAYTYSKDLTTQSTDRSGLSTYQYNLKMDYGPSNYNQPQTFTANYVYDLPWYKGQARASVGKVAGGVGGFRHHATPFRSVLQCQSAPRSLGSRRPGINVGLGTGGTRPDQVAPVHMTKTVGAWFTTSSFNPAEAVVDSSGNVITPGHFGSEGSGSLIGPGFENWDLAASRT